MQALDAVLMLNHALHGRLRVRARGLARRRWNQPLASTLVIDRRHSDSAAGAISARWR